MSTLASIIPSGTTLFILLFAGLALIIAGKAVQTVPQSMNYIVERFGKYTRTLQPGLTFIVPVLDRVAHKISILERQLPEFSISVITKDNVEIDLISTVFFRINDPRRTTYRIRDIDAAITTTATSTVRSAVGKLELDDVQSSRALMNKEIHDALSAATEEWGILISRTEILDVQVDKLTKDSQRLQLNAERERRAAVAKAEGDRKAVELAADAELYQAQKQADAVRIAADAKAYQVEIEAKADANAIKVKAEADAEQTRVVAQAIQENGQPAVDFEVRKRQVSAIADLSASPSTKTLILPAEVTGVLGALDTLAQGYRAS